MADSRFFPASRAAWVTCSAIALAAGVWVLYTFPPAGNPYYPQCVFRTATGLDCPGCGITRALHHLLHGRITDAFRMNPLLFVMLTVALCAIPSVIRGERPQFLAKPWFGWACVIVVSGWWIVRNVVSA